MRGPVLKQAPTERPRPPAHSLKTPPTLRSSSQFVQCSAAGNKILPALSAARCTILRGACIVHGPQLYLNLSSCRDVAHITHLGLLLGGGCGAAAMFCLLSGTLTLLEVKRWWGRIGLAISPGKSRPWLTGVMTAASILSPSPMDRRFYLDN